MLRGKTVVVGEVMTGTSSTWLSDKQMAIVDGKEERIMQELIAMELVVDEVEVNKPKMDNSNVSMGCWGDTGSDANNLC